MSVGIWPLGIDHSSNNKIDRAFQRFWEPPHTIEDFLFIPMISKGVRGLPFFIDSRRYSFGMGGRSQLWTRSPRLKFRLYGHGRLKKGMFDC